MKLIIKLHPEIAIKSKSVRKRFTKLLETNIRMSLRRIVETVYVRNDWDKIMVTVTGDVSHVTQQQLLEQLQRIPGIVQFNLVDVREFSNLEDIFRQVHELYAHRLKHKTFSVRVKRTGNHPFTSQDVARYVGGGLNQQIESAQVQLKNPQVIVPLEIKDDKLFVVKQNYQGIGGFPLPTQGDVLSLISGGFDSGVASYLMIRKGTRTHFCFFNLGGRAHEIGVKQVAYYLWHRYSITHKVRFITVDFEPVVVEILENITNSYMSVILKRMMMRSAAEIATKLGIQALVTGESIGQVSSQTLTNLGVIDQVTPHLIVRPLIHHDKQEIINIANAIGTTDFAKTMPEYCGVISNKPNTKAQLDAIELEEQKFDFALLARVTDACSVSDIRDIAMDTEQQVSSVESVSQLSVNDVVIDVRAPDEEDEDPLILDSVEVIHIPFFKLAHQFKQLDQSKHYLLYCKRGVMSKLQALLLHDSGFNNVKVYQP